MMKHFFAALLLVVSVSGAAWSEGPATGTLTGRMMIAGETPMTDGLVYVYNLARGPAPSAERYWRIPDASARLDGEGRFSLKLAPGEYSVGAIKRARGVRIGPPDVGDHFLVAQDEKGIPLKFSVAAPGTRDIGMISGARPYRVSSEIKGITALEGIVLDRHDRPVEGAMVFAFSGAAVVGKPLFVSNRSDREGKFLLRTHEGGTYFLKVRDTFGGGPPVEGSLYDGEKEEPMLQVMLTSGEITRGVTLRGNKFRGRGKEKEEQFAPADGRMLQRDSLGPPGPENRPDHAPRQ